MFLLLLVGFQAGAQKYACDKMLYKPDIEREYIERSRVNITVDMDLKAGKVLIINNQAKDTLKLTIVTEELEDSIESIHSYGAVTPSGKEVVFQTCTIKDKTVGVGFGADKSMRIFLFKEENNL